MATETQSRGNRERTAESDAAELRMLLGHYRPSDYGRQVIHEQRTETEQSVTKSLPALSDDDLVVVCLVAAVLGMG